MPVESRPQSFSFYPILILSYFFLHIWSVNIERLHTFNKLFPAYITALLIMALLWVLIAFVLKNTVKSAFVTALWTFVFFSYGHVREVLTPHFYIPNKFFVPIFLAVFGLILSLVLRSQKRLEYVPRYLNIATGLLVLIPLMNILIHTHFASPVQDLTEAWKTSPLQTQHAQIQDKPDIYYLIVDEYGREDVLKEVFNYDNQPFIKFLANKGFYIAEASHSNYTVTTYSLASSLNMLYLKSIYEDIVTMIQKSTVAKFLKRRQGYKIVFLDSGFLVTGSSPLADKTISYNGTTDLDLVLMNTTLLRPLSAALLVNDWRRRHLYNFEELAHAAKLPGPKFIFAHILLPHPPFVFKKDGSATPGQILRVREVPHERYKEFYPQQLDFLNTKLIDLISSILSQSGKPPIIILQSDHGIDPFEPYKMSDEALKQRMSNFTAILLPDKGKEKLYASITPVNIFRIIFDSYFGTRLGKLEDKIFLENAPESENPIIERLFSGGESEQPEFADVTAIVKRA